MIGPGKYGWAAQALIESLEAESLVLIVINGKNGTGFEVKMTSLDLARVVAEKMKEVAAKIESEADEMRENPRKYPPS